MNVWQWLSGKKTYIGIIAATVFSLAATEGWIDVDKWQWLALIIAGWTGVAITHKADKAVAAVAATAGNGALLKSSGTNSGTAETLPLTETLAVRQGDGCDQCNATFQPGDRVYQRAMPPSVVCQACAKATDLYVGRLGVSTEPIRGVNASRGTQIGDAARN